MALTTDNLTGEQAWDRSQWCQKSVQALSERSSDSDAAYAWWDNECDKPDWLEMSLSPGQDVNYFIERLQAEGHRWAEVAGGLYAEEDGFGTAEQSTRSLDNTSVAVERVADYFVGYLFERYQGTRHVRRVATWIGFLLKAIERIAGESLARSRSRQLTFDYRNRRFKARYSHQAGPRGGIEIVEVLSGRGAPEGDVVLTITSLSEAEDAYHSLETRLDRFIG